MNKNIIVTLIAGSFFAASIVGPAFASSPNITANQQPAPTTLPGVDIVDRVPDIVDRLPDPDRLRDRLRNLDVGDIVDRTPVVIDSVPDVVASPAPAPEQKVDDGPPPPAVDAPTPAAPRAVDTDVRAQTDRNAVKSIVDETKAEKARILAAHGGDRRAAKAELKAAQKRMVSRIRANNGRGGRNR